MNIRTYPGLYRKVIWIVNKMNRNPYKIFIFNELIGSCSPQSNKRIILTMLKKLGIIEEVPCLRYGKNYIQKKGATTKGYRLKLTDSHLIELKTNKDIKTWIGEIKKY